MKSDLTFDEVVLGRRSARGFKREPVPKALIREVVEIAMRAPSSLNTQPWNFYVVAGEPLDRIRAGNTERNLAGVPSSREFRSHGEYAGVHRERQIGIAKQLFAVMGIERHDQFHVKPLFPGPPPTRRHGGAPDFLRLYDVKDPTPNERLD
jgi:nitroreductase